MCCAGATIGIPRVKRDRRSQTAKGEALIVRRRGLWQGKVWTDVESGREALVTNHGISSKSGAVGPLQLALLEPPNKAFFEYLTRVNPA